jgi:hypothetical protein
MIVVVVLGEVGGSRFEDLCVGCRRSGPIARLGDVSVAAEILIDDALVERQSALVAVAMDGF